MADIHSNSNSNSNSDSDSFIDPKSGFCSKTRIFHCLRPALVLPPPSHPLSITSYTLSLLHSSDSAAALHSTAFLIDAASGHRLTFSTFLQQVSSLSSSLIHALPSLQSKNDVAFILAPSSLHLPVLYFSLLSLGLVLSPSNPLSTPSELAHQIHISKPAIAFTTSHLAHKLPKDLPFILLDSPDFLSMLQSRENTQPPSVVVNQSDSAAILYSSGTTGRVKGVVVTHRNLIALIAGFNQSRHLDVLSNDVPGTPVSLFTLPLFHVFGFFMLIRIASLGETIVLMERFDFVKMLEALEKYRVMYMPVSPPLVLALAKLDVVKKYDLSSLRRVGCGGAPLGKDVAQLFKARFPHVDLIQGYGLTETAGAATRTIGAEALNLESAGSLSEGMEAKIVDPETGKSLMPGERGELWLRGPMIMKGYAGDDEATAETLDSEGWLKTGDLCYFDSEGHLYIVDRLKELIKYKAYQVPPAELEHILQSMPDISDAAVIPFPDEEAGQIPMAYVVRKPSSTVSAAQIMDFVAKQVAPYKKIRRVAFIDSIPKSAAGKILRRELINHSLAKPSSKL